ncbi:MAG TPA: TonB family protein [Campylobacterales bacterium]|nr:TonB family protein [Campylobacterales bacterium]
MRLFKALIISLLVYALFIWVYLTYFSKIQTASVEPHNHVIKIDIRDIPLAAKPIAQKKIEKKLVEKKPLVKKEPFVQKKIVKKKKVVKKKPIKKKIVKKKIVKKKPVNKKIVKKKKIIKKPIVLEVPIEDLPIAQTIPLVEELPMLEETPVDNSFMEEMVHIPEPMIKPKPKETQAPADDLGSFFATPSTPVSPWSYPNDKIRKLYGAGFHDFTPTQKKFIENNLESIQEITQRTLTQRGYPEGAGRTGQQGTNVVSFNLHPNGNISDLRLKTRIGYRALDDNTLSLIRVAYMDYPYPSTTTKIIFYVTYSIYGY